MSKRIKSKAKAKRALRKGTSGMYKPSTCKKPSERTVSKRLKAAKKLQGIWSKMDPGWPEGWNDR
jgi:hypothetical protein